MAASSPAGRVFPVAVLADTHLRTDPAGAARRRWLPEAVVPYLEAASAIIHAGDLLDEGVLRALAKHAPVFAVLGNNDISLAGVLPVRREVELAGVRFGIVHDSGATAGRARRLRRIFPSADVVVFGHSHAPVDELGEGGQILFNPGSPTQRRAQPVHTIGELTLAGGSVLRRRIIPLEPS